MSANLSNKRSRVGYVAVGYVEADDNWVTSERVYSVSTDAIKNLEWCYNVRQDTISTVRIALK